MSEVLIKTAGKPWLTEGARSEKHSVRARGGVIFPLAITYPHLNLTG